MTRSQRTAPQGFLRFILPLMLGLVAVTVLLSGRDLSRMFEELAAGGGMQLHPAVPWLQRGVSLLLVLIAAERLVNHAVRHRPVPSPLLMGTFVAFWLATVAAPALFGAHRQVSHEYAYSLLIGLAGLVATDKEGQGVIEAARTALFLFLIASVAMIGIDPQMALDAKYKQGLMPGVPRFGGLATHAVAMGMFAQTFLLCLWARPFHRRWLTVIGWILGLGVLFFAQSKTAWIAFLLCTIVMVGVRHGGNWWRRAGDPRQGDFGIVACLAVIVLVASLVTLFLVVPVGEEAADFLSTDEGAQLMSMTGRDQIWAIAMEEWHASPVFGYGPGLWDDAFRQSIHMANATNAHNQFLDTLARSGVVGATALVAYGLVLLVLSVRYAKATGGFSLALFIALALRSISEVPLLLFGYGTELFAHVLLLVTLAAAAADKVEEVTEAEPATGRRAYRVAS